MTEKEVKDWIVITAVLVEKSTEQEAREAAMKPGVAPAAIVKIVKIQTIDSLELATRFVGVLAENTKFGGLK